MTPAPAPPPAEAYQCISTPAAARALLAIILAPLHALIEACLADILARLEDMLTQWRNGTLPSRPPVRPRANRPTTSRTAPQAPSESCEPWLARLIALAASDQPGPAARPRARRSPTSTDQAPAPAMPNAGHAPRAPTNPIRPRVAPLAFIPWRLGGESVLRPPQPGTRQDRISKNPAPRLGERTTILLRYRN